MTTLRRLLLCLLMGLLPLAASTQASARAFDHGGAAWGGLVKKHVRRLPDGQQSRVDDAGFQADRAALGKVLASLGAVGR